MNHPQTLAIELNKTFPNKTLEAIGKWGCCAFVLLWCLGLEPEDVDAICIVNSLMKKGALDKECTVSWAKAIDMLTGRKLKEFDKVKIKSIRSIKERTPVLYETTYVDQNGEVKVKGHFVGVENGRIGFNPLSHSECVEKGKPTEMRRLVI